MGRSSAQPARPLTGVRTGVRTSSVYAPADGGQARLRHHRESTRSSGSRPRSSGSCAPHPPPARCQAHDIADTLSLTTSRTLRPGLAWAGESGSVARDGVPVSPEFAALVARYVEGERFNVRAQCASVGCSTTTFYKYAARFAERGVQGLYPDSRRPASSPAAVTAQVEDLVVLARKGLHDGGWDAGADSIRYQLQAWRDGLDGGAGPDGEQLCGLVAPQVWPAAQRSPREPRSTGSWTVVGSWSRSRSGVRGAHGAGSRPSSPTRAGRWTASRSP